MKSGNGFTLIELLVVIAIIGILAAIVLVSLSSAKSKANDSSVKSMLTSARSAAEEYYIGNNYGFGTSSGSAGSCGNGSPNGSAMWAHAGSNMANIIASIQAAVGSSNMDCGTTASAWSIAVKLPSGGYWCADGNGSSRGTQSNGSAYAGLNAGATNAHTSAGATTCN